MSEKNRSRVEIVEVVVVSTPQHTSDINHGLAIWIWRWTTLFVFTFFLSLHPPFHTHTHPTPLPTNHPNPLPFFSLFFSFPFLSKLRDVDVENSLTNLKNANSRNSLYVRQQKLYKTKNSTKPNKQRRNGQNFVLI